MSELKRAKIVAQNVRFSFAHVFEPKQFAEEGKAKYQVTLLIPKSTKQGKALIKQIQDEIENLKNENLKGTFKGSLGSKFWSPLRDGDEDKPDTEGYEGMMFICCKSDRKPDVFDSKLQPIVEREEFYSGCYGHASFNLYPYNSNGSKGIGAGLLGVVKLKDGEPFGEGGSSVEDFKTFMDVDAGEQEEDENFDW